MRLSPKRHQLFLEVARLVGYDPTDCPFDICDGRLQSLDPEFAAAMLFRLQHDAKHWFSEKRQRVQARLALERSVAELTAILLEHAPGITAVFEPDDSRASVGSVEAICVRLSPTLRKTIARMAQLVRDNDLAYVVRTLDRGDSGWRCRYVGDPARYISATTTVYVSASEVWVKGHSRVTDAVFVGKPISLWDLVPEDELGVRVIELPKVLPGCQARPYAEELQRITEARKALAEAQDAVCEGGDLAAPGKGLPDAVRICLLDEERHALEVAREAMASLGPRLEQWEAELELTQQALAESVLDARPGDVVIANVQGRAVRLLVDHISGFPTDDGFLMHVSGRRFRKDGTPGKRNQDIFVRAPRDGENGPIE